MKVRDVHPLEAKLGKNAKIAFFRSLGYEPSPGQRQFHDARNRFRLLCAGSRFGKSMAAGYEILWYLLYPGAHIWTCGPKYDQASKEFKYTVDALRMMPHKGWQMPIKRLMENVQAGQMSVELDMSEGTGDPRKVSWLIAKSWHEPDTLLGEELDLLVLSEGSLCPLGVWNRYLRARVGSRFGDVIVPTTPHGMDDFLYPTFFEPAMRGDSDYWCGQYGTWDNPHHPPEDIAHARRTMNELEFQEQYAGQFVSFTGRVYREFRREIHVIQPLETPREWPRWRAMDYGYEDPFACLWFTADAEGRLYLYREHYKRRQMLSENASQIIDASVYQGTKEPERYEYTVLDPASRQMRMETGMSIATHLSELGLPSIMGVNDIEAGVFRVMEWLKVDSVSGKPGLHLFANCVNTIAEFEKYSWAEPKKDGTSQHMNTQDKNNHSCDAARYMIMTRPRRYVAEDKIPPRSFRALRERIKEQERGKNVLGGSPPPSVIGW